MSFTVRLSRPVAALAASSALLAAFWLPGSAFAGACSSGPSTLCLQGDRFQVEVDWQLELDSGQGLVVPFASNDTGFFRYGDPQAAELLVRVLDFCGFTGSYAVALAPVSTAGQTVTITDLELGNSTSYTFIEGNYSDPLVDTQALPCAAPFGPGDDPVGGLTEGVAGGTELLLAGGRFSAELTFDAGVGSTANGSPVALLDRAGGFELFSPTPEALMKITPPTNGFFGVVISALANVEYELRVTDLCGLTERVYTQPANTTATIADEDAFPVDCPLIFGDGFESGDVLSWSNSSGGL